MIVIGTPANQIPVYDAWLIYKNSTAYFQVVPALFDGGYAPAFDTPGIGRYFHTVADTSNGLINLEEMTR